MKPITKRFEIQELQKVVEPYDLIDILDSLLDNEYLDGYYYDFEANQVELLIPSETELNLILSDLGSLKSQFKNRKGDMH